MDSHYSRYCVYFKSKHVIVGYPFVSYLLNMLFTYCLLSHILVHFILFVIEGRDSVFHLSEL